MATETFTKSPSKSLAIAMIAATVLASSLVSGAQAGSGGGDSGGGDREQRMSFSASKKKAKRCKSNAYYKKDAQAFCARKLGKPKNKVKCGGRVRRWICT